MFKRQQISHVVFAASDIHPESSQAVYINHTLHCLSTMLEFLKAYPRVHFTLLSTTAVYNKENTLPNAESAATNLPQDFYSLVQTSLETILQLYQVSHNLAITVLRLSHVYGPWAGPRDQVHKLVEKTLHSQYARQVWNISNIGLSQTLYIRGQDFLYIDDAVQGIIQAMQAGFKCGVFNLGCGDVSTLEDVHGMIFSISKDISTPVHSSHKHTSLPYFYFKVPNVYKYINYPVNIKKAQQLIHFVPKVSLTVGLEAYISWYEHSRELLYPCGKHDVIFTSFFTSKSDPQRKKRVKPNKFEYMKTWYWSLRDRLMRGVVFHDGLDDTFINKVSDEHIIFQLVSLAGRSTNDARFYAYLRYLQDHPSIQRVILTDISDVKFQKSPFDLMDILGDMLYIGTDIDLFPNMASMGWLTTRLHKCFGRASVTYGEIASVLKLNMVYNAGVIGGTRSLMMEFLQRLTAVLNRTPRTVNCNMPAVNYVVHKYFDSRVFTGFPLTSRFMKRQGAPKGIYIVHK